MSNIFEGFLSTSEVLDAFGERNFLDAMLRFEASLARAQASLGLIPEAAAQSIIGTCKVDLFDVAKIVREGGRTGSVAVAALLATMPQEHERALGNWQAELAEWPGLLMSAHGSARAMAQALPGLQVDTLRMRANLERLRSELPSEIADEWFNAALARHAAELTHAQVSALRAPVA